MGQHFRHLTGAGYGFSAIFNAGRMNGDDPLISLDLSADGVSYAPVFHMVHLMPRGPKGEKRPADVIGAVKAHRLSPAMAAGLTDKLLSMSDLAEMVDAAQPKSGKRGPYKKQEAA